MTDFTVIILEKYFLAPKENHRIGRVNGNTGINLP